MTPHFNIPLPIIDKTAGAVRPVVVFRGIPTALGSRKPNRNWVNWRWSWKGSRWDKPPLRARDLHNASTAEADSWATADEAEATAGRQHVGIGYVLTSDPDLCVLDLDNVIDENGGVAPWAEALIIECGSYTERSPSGSGFKIFGIASGLDLISTKVPAPSGELEIFHHARRYVVVTGASDAPDAPLSDLTGVVTRILGQREPVATAAASERAESRREDVAKALDGYWSPDDYADWVEAALALHGVPWGEEMWLEWSKKSPKFEEAENRKKWSQTQPNRGITPRTILARVPRAVLGQWARAHGHGAWSRPYSEILDAARTVDGGNAEAVTALVAEVAHLDPIQCESALKEIKKRTGLGIGALRRQAAISTQGPPDQLVLARMVVDQLGRANILFTNGALWGWTARGVWKEQDDRLYKQGIQHTADTEGVTISATLVNGVLDVFKSEVLSPNHRFNQGNPEVVNCLNGELELLEARWCLVPHRRDHFRTTQIPVAYDPAATAPAFMAFLNQVFRDDPDGNDKVRAVLELMGYTLMSHARHEKFVILIGPGANGKSVLLSVIEALCGVENVAGVQPSQFHRTFQRAHLDQKLANIVTELRQGEIIADAELKAITSGEASTVEHKFRDPFVMHPFATCWFGANHMPHTRDFSDALFRRATILPFGRVFSPGEQDPMLKDKLKAELPGILRMALEAYRMALLVGFTDASSSQAAKQEWRLEADQVAQFVEERCVRAIHGKILIGTLYETYRSWALEQGITRTVSKKSLRERLTRLGFGETRQSYGRFVVGLEIASEGFV